ncbi:MAG: sigma-54-dependent Fis family transcriptional regulator [Calditrichaeota bacterium]|nr:MAG: sigma-54-dependent Fis family transcriptional regulator [Calditrichota bacterium]
MKPCPVKILLVGFETKQAAQIREAVRSNTNCEIIPAEESAAAEGWNVVFAAIGGDAQTAKNIIARFKSENRPIKTILFSTDLTHDFMVPLIREGAWNILPLPVQPNSILREIKNLTSEIKTRDEPGHSSTDLKMAHKMVGDSPGMQHLLRDIKKAAPTNARVLINGENGVGKELVAKAIHEGSDRADKPFVKVNCAAIPRELIESELFGYEKGAFTGAVEQKKGLIGHAHTGTLFLDEIGDMAIETQVKVLRVLQENQYISVGGSTPISFDVRIVSATNKNLRQEIVKGNFRKDLYFRLNVIPLHVPPLRERSTDILPLFAHFVKVNNFKEKLILPDAAKLMRNYIWPGNVRELYNLVERISAMVVEPEISADALLKILPEMEKHVVGSFDGSPRQKTYKRTLRESLEAYEAELLQKCYEDCDGNISKMARALVTDRANLHKKLKKYDIG